LQLYNLYILTVTNWHFERGYLFLLHINNQKLQTSYMKKVFLLISAALLVTGVALADTGKKKSKKCAKGKTCCTKSTAGKSCCKDKKTAKM